MKKHLLFVVFIYFAVTSFGQKGSDYYMPLCPGNQTVFQSPDNNFWGGRTSTYTIIKTESINGVLYYVEEGKEYMYNGIEAPKAFRYFWLRVDQSGNVLLKAFSDSSPILTTAIIFPEEGVIFSNNFLTAGYSLTQPVSPEETITDTVISTNATFGVFNNCIQIREINKTNGITGIVDDTYYALGVGRIGLNRITQNLHTDFFASTFTTGCEPIIDTLPPKVVTACLGQNFDYYVSNVIVNTQNNTLTATWFFQDGGTTNQFNQTYVYNYKGNNVIGITLQCGKSSLTTFYKTINISESLVGMNKVIKASPVLNIYPNPGSDVVNIELSNTNSADLTLNIYTALGALVRSEMLKQNQRNINVEDLSNGIYLVEIKSKEWTKKQKLIIQK